MAYDVEDTVARVEAMSWPRRAKEITAYVLRTGRLPEAAGLAWSGTADIDDAPESPNGSAKA